MKVGIIGTGLQFNRRAPIIDRSDFDEISIVCGKNKNTLKKIKQQYNCEITHNWEEVVEKKDLDIIVICTPPDLHSKISINALKKGKHVLCEKPLSRTLSEAKEMVLAAKANNKILKCGFNHRHHPAIINAKSKVNNTSFGNILFARCRYGICGRSDYHKEWRANPLIASGGHFIEQGSHIIDLFRWFLGDLSQVSCMTSKNFYTKQNLDDSGMAIFRSSKGATASLHTSLTEWKNLFSFEVFGENQFVQIEGLGGGYGVEKLIHGIRDHKKPFSYNTIEFRGADKSWLDEWIEFTDAIKQNREPLGSGFDGMKVMEIALKAYEAEKQNKVLFLNNQE